MRATDGKTNKCKERGGFKTSAAEGITEEKNIKPHETRSQGRIQMIDFVQMSPHL